MSNGNSRSETSRYNRRSFLAATGTAAVGAGVSTAGCIDALTSEEIEGILIPGLIRSSLGSEPADVATEIAEAT
ncbi:twin-arginine translocation signal domain-containing protein [Salinarchaeum sp. IM2453]|uniref:twin-arginine translocation signal domain-containing protein n=1 Tax=Salinarchaeum sp. IM2453 TaxID=2862870 RepID=UPI001C82F32E|nr:twin-arginine translocation signal domain-containing protein [Salinarchaeum sp. IM2453]QZA88272.1 twin-arginine translocation signal domain-containing protein [Salinarchaeum sp. IM2453]